MVEQYDVGGKEWRERFHYEYQRDDSYMAEWQNFIDCVNEHKIPLITGEDGLKVLQIIEAARLSAVSGGTVSVTAIPKKKV